ncbi:MAG: DNA recombination protein RecF [Porphyromonadaceae bacterium CG2_30_38_12]|nr:MAG: DNA recombination protein RecF [Porphyromonadaceae bacterium CG2_30_38_12]
MLINSLSLLNYKNIAEAELTFSPKINCFIGDNGMGKTNVLDALYFLSFCKSYSNSIDSQNITHEADFFMIRGNYILNSQPEEIYCGMKRKQKKQFKRNKKEYDKLSDHIGLIPLVFISPDDLYLISEGSEERRKFIDGVISQCNHAYLQQLISYNTALKQRNALLKSDQAVDFTLFEIWEELMVKHGTFIFEERKRFLEEFVPVFRDIYHKISGGNELIDLVYSSQHASNEIVKLMAQHRERDKILGYSTQGIHKDELEMLLDGFPIKRVGSQGQNKTYLVSLKFAQYFFLQRAHQLSPILLLDDIFDKLDANRVQKIIEIVSGKNFGQIFITDTNREHLDTILAGLQSESKIFTVVNGEILSN